MIILTSTSYAEKKWKVEEGAIYTNGIAVNGHRFGFFNDKEFCDHDLIFVHWSTYEKGLEKFEGIDVQIAIYLDNNKEPVLIMPSTLMTTLDFTSIMTVGVFKTIVFSKDVIEKIKKSNSVKLEFIGPENLISVLDMKFDEFDTSGLQEAYLKLDNSCK